MKTINPNAHIICARIKERAKELGLTQADIHRLTGAAKSSVHSWFKDSVPRGEYAKELCKILKCSMDWLMAGRGSPAISNEEQFYSALDASWASSSEVTTKWVRINRYGLNNESEIADGQFIIVPRAVFANASNIDCFFYYIADTDSCEPVINKGDTCVIDGGDTGISNAGHYHLIKHGGGYDIARIKPDIDGTWVLHYGNKNQEKKLTKADQNLIKVIGTVIYHSGFLK